VALPHCQWFGSRQGFALEFDSLGPVGNRLLTLGEAFGLRPKNPYGSLRTINEVHLFSTSAYVASQREDEWALGQGAKEVFDPHPVDGREGRGV